MSRIGKKPVTIPEGVAVEIVDHTVTAKGPKGELAWQFHPEIGVAIIDGQVQIKPVKETRLTKALWGTTRARINNLVIGVKEGYSKELELHGVGYRAAVKGNNLELNLGFSHPVKIAAPAGISFAVKENVIEISGADKVVVGQTAARIRAVRKPEPYKGKGVRYRGEIVRRKAGKVVGSTS